MPDPRHDRRDPAPNKPGKPGIQYAENSKAHPIITEQRTARNAPTDRKGAMLSPHPNPAYSTALKVSEQPTPGDDVDRNVLEVFETLPGPAITTTRLDDDGEPVTVTRQRMKVADIVTTETLTATDTVWTRKFKGEGDANVALQITEVRALPGNLIEELEQYDDTNKVFVSTFSRLVKAGTEPEAPSTSATQAYAMYHNAVASLVITDPGNGYTTLPTLSIGASPGGGTQATGSVTSLAAVVAQIVAPGSGHVIGDIITFTGGTVTASDYARATIASMALATLALDAAGTGYNPADIILLFGGVYSEQATVTIATTKLVGVTVNAAGTGMVAGSTTLTLVPVGGTSTTSATLTVATTKVVSATVAAAGTSGTPGTQTVTGTTGTGTKFQASVTVDGGGTVSAVLSITVAGNYTVNPTTISAEPVTGAGLSGAQLSVTMGVLTVTIANAGAFTDNATSFTSTGGGNNATFSAPIFGVGTFTVSTGGVYTTTPTTFSQESVSPSGGLGATFQSPTWTPLTLSIYDGGTYTAIPGNPAAQSASSGAGTGMTVTLDFGLGVVALGTAGTLYRDSFVPVTVTGNGAVTAVMDTATKTLATGYIVASEMRAVAGSTLVRRYIFKLMPIPPTRMDEQPDIAFEWPAIFQLLTPFFSGSTASPGFDYTLLPHRRGRYTGSTYKYHKIGQFTDLPARFSMHSPASASRIIDIPNNCVHAAATWGRYTDGVLVYAEKFAASTPYSIGQWIVIVATQERLAGEIWQKSVTWLREPVV